MPPSSFLIHQHQTYQKPLCFIPQRRFPFFFSFKTRRAEGFFKPFRRALRPQFPVWFWCRGRDRIPTDRAFFPSLKLTASSHLKMDGWNMIVSFWEARPIFRCELLVYMLLLDIQVFSGSFQWVLLEISWTQENYGNKTLKPYEHINIFLD